MTGKRTLLSWSSGKDSAFALYLLRKTTEIEVVGLFTTMNSTHKRVAMHAVKEAIKRCDSSSCKARGILAVWVISIVRNGFQQRGGSLDPTEPERQRV